MADDLLLYGDPHGNWQPLMEACEKDPPAAVVIVGDMEVDRPLRRILTPLSEQGIACRYIIGNHDLVDGTMADRILSSMPDENLHGQAERIAGIWLAGLGGVYRGRVWYPRPDGDRNPIAEPRHRSRADYLSATPKSNLFRGGLPLHMRGTIFPEDHEGLSKQVCDVLVCHEAPTSHEHGFPVIDELARKMGARLVVHGHHHRRYEGRTADGIRVIGLGIADVLRIRREDLA